MLDRTPFSREAKLVYAEALDIAREGRKPFDSAHLVLAIFTVRCEAHSILIEKRLTLDAVLDVLAGIAPEAAETVGLVYSTAEQVAANVGSPQITSVHLLMAISRLPSTRAARVLERAGLPMYALRTQAMAHLTDPRMRRAAIERMGGNGHAVPPAPLGVPVPVPVAVPRPSPEPRPSVEQRPALAPVRPPAPAPAPAAPAPVAPAPAPRGTAAPMPWDESAPIRFDTLDDEAGDESPADEDGGTETPGEPRRPALDVVRDRGAWALDPERFPTLVALGQNLNVKAERGDVDPLVGREDALDRVVDILCKRRSNNPLLLGDPGVGKTALVEGLARLIVERGEDLPGLEGKVIVSVSVADLLAGTAMRGAFAARLKALKDEVLAADRRVILFIDEIHTLIGAGVGDGGMDAANDLKGALARGEFPCIGATTFGEYKVHIVPDDALRRRFDLVYLREPTLPEAERILEGVAPRYASHHRVEFSQEAFRTAVRLTDRLVPDRSLPAKAIEVLDRAGARVRRQGRTEVGREDVVNALAAMVDLPREFLAVTPAERFRGKEAALRDRVRGHDAACSSLMRTLAQNWARFGSRRPLGSFVFAGPAGVGKRTAAVALADLLFGSPQALLEVDLADYSEGHSLSHLVGSPPGYVGHEEGGLLADTLVRRPFLLVLWHHADQAHPSVQSLVTQVLTEGTATDRRGRRMDFRNTVHVLTVAEEGAGTASRPVGFGPAHAEAATRPAAEPDPARLRKVLPADVLNAVDQVLAFGPLDGAALAGVAARILKSAADSFAEEHGVRLEVDGAVADALARHAARRGGGPSLVDSTVAERVLRPAGDLVYASADPPAAVRVAVAGEGPDGPRIAVGDPGGRQGGPTTWE
ncbi:MAG: AAA family ATPase [Deltaproteobacteria bacterium]|nr:AAA family ATPase [Deltaproteobacteria bacterium]